MCTVTKAYLSHGTIMYIDGVLQIAPATETRELGTCLLSEEGAELIGSGSMGSRDLKDIQEARTKLTLLIRKHQ